jgi:hypothetical protein
MLRHGRSTSIARGIAVASNCLFSVTGRSAALVILGRAGRQLAGTVGYTYDRLAASIP